MIFIGNFCDAKFLGVAGVDVMFMQEYITSWVRVLLWDLVLRASVSTTYSCLLNLGTSDILLKSTLGGVAASYLTLGGCSTTLLIALSLSTLGGVAASSLTLKGCSTTFLIAL